MKDNRTLNEVTENFGMSEGVDKISIPGTDFVFTIPLFYKDKPAKKKSGHVQHKSGHPRGEWFVNKKGKVTFLDDWDKEKKMAAFITKEIGL